MNGIEFDSIRWETYEFASSRNTTYYFVLSILFSFFFPAGIICGSRDQHHPSLELSSVFSVASLLCRGTSIDLSSWWQIWARDRHYLFFRRHSRGTLWYDRIQNRMIDVSAAVAPFDTRRGSRVIASVVVVDCPQSYDGLPRGTLVGPVRTCHASSMESCTSYRTPPPRPCIYLGITRTRNFCKLCTPCHEYPGYGYSIFIPTRNVSKFCTPVPQYPKLLEALNTYIPVPGTSVTSIRRSDPYPDLL